MLCGGNISVTIKYKGYTITQSEENGHIWISKGDDRVHINCDEILTKDKLIAKADGFIKIEEIFEDLFNDEVQQCQ